MVFIPGATFEMGAGGHIEPVTTVTLPPYYLDRTEVSVAAYDLCVQNGRCTSRLLDSCGDQSNWGHAGRDNHPMNCVDWEQARAFCEAVGSRLPSEAEWEFAARGTDGRPYPWGFTQPTPELAQFHMLVQGRLASNGVRMKPAAFTSMVSEGRGTSPVDSHAAGASPFGVLNMAGNVWEWVEDVFGPYSGGAVAAPRRTAGPNSDRVVRGGGYSSVNGAGLRAYDRDSADPHLRGPNLGFRCARDAER